MLQQAMPPKLEDGIETERVQLVAPATLMRRIDEWRATQRPIPNKSEAIRMLVEQALSPRAALAAMREPTDAMENSVYAAELDIYWGYSSDGRPGGPGDVWRVMVDAAIGQESESRALASKKASET